MVGITVNSNIFYPRAQQPGRISKAGALVGAINALLLARQFFLLERDERMVTTHAVICLATLPPASLALISPKLGDIACTICLVSFLLFAAASTLYQRNHARYGNIALLAWVLEAN